MLTCLSVKNFALIKEAQIDFKNNLNVLTGETGSGKSILIDSINLALGMRANKEYMRDENGDTVVSISFNVDDEKLIKTFEDMDIDCDDGNVIIYRKITKDKNIVKINDIPCTLAKIKEVTEKLIDIYGQHDSVDLKNNKKHIEFLDDFIGDEVYIQKQKMNSIYDEFLKAKKKLNSFDMDESMRLREIDILKYEIEELEEARLKPNEEEELEEKFKIAANSKNIIEALENAEVCLQETNISNAIREITYVAKHDSSLNEIKDTMMDIDSLIQDTIKTIDKKRAFYDIDEKEYFEMGERLDTIRSILAKYNNDVNKAIKEIDIKKTRLAELSDYENEKKKIEKLVKSCKDKFVKECVKLSELRKKGAKEFEEKLIYEVKDLGFLDVKFFINFEEKKEMVRDGIDEVTFMISLNTGEKIKPLNEIASGGELSRIMLSIKTILSDNYGIGTLIFDEIDAGISGITATKVAKKLNKISKNRQVILITHLPQIAAMADNHFVIKKAVKDDRTITTIDILNEDGMIDEIGRLISSDKITESVLANARELKDMAKKEKLK